MPWQWEAFRLESPDWEYTGPWNPFPEPFELPPILTVGIDDPSMATDGRFSSVPVIVAFPDGSNHSVRVELQSVESDQVQVFRLVGRLYLDGALIPSLTFVNWWNHLFSTEYNIVSPEHVAFLGWSDGTHLVRPPSLRPRPWDYVLQTIPPVGTGANFVKTEGDTIETPLLASELNATPNAEWSVEFRYTPSLSPGENETIFSSWDPLDSLVEFTLIRRDPSVATTGRFRLTFGGAIQGIDWYEWFNVAALLDGMEHVYRFDRTFTDRIQLFVDGVYHSEVLHSTNPARYFFPAFPLVLGKNRTGPDLTGVLRRISFSREGVPLTEYYLDDQTSGTNIIDHGSAPQLDATLVTNRIDPNTFWVLNL
jgi:hypothetical protein